MEVRAPREEGAGGALRIKRQKQQGTSPGLGTGDLSLNPSFVIHLLCDFSVLVSYCCNDAA